MLVEMLRASAQLGTHAPLHDAAGAQAVYFEQAAEKLETLAADNERLTKLAAAMYQVVGTLASYAGVFGAPQVEKVLDALGNASDGHAPDDAIDTLLPWPEPQFPENLADALEARADLAEKANGELREAVKELVRLKDLKDELRGASWETPAEWHALVDKEADYKRSQPLSWITARSLSPSPEKKMADKDEVYTSCAASGKTAENRAAVVRRIWFDTEFIEDGRTIDLISIGMVREDGAELYLENGECDLTRASEWVRANVIPHLHLGNALASRRHIADMVKLFAGKSPEFWAYYADYDWVALCQLYGTMMDLPKGWPMYCRDIKQWCDALGNPKLPEQSNGEHHALADARWNREAWLFLRTTNAELVHPPENAKLK